MVDSEKQEITAADVGDVAALAVPAVDEHDLPLDEAGRRIGGLQKKHDGPRCTSFRLTEGHVFYQRDGKLHSEEGKPAVVYADGTQWWYQNGLVHREDGPAVTFPDGTEEWWQNNKRHRLGNPAVTYSPTAADPAHRAVKQWWVQGVLIKEAVPPPVRRYRALMRAARKTCFGV